MSNMILWLGSQESYDIVIKAQDQVQAQIATGKLKAYDEETDSHGMPKIWQKRGDTAVINISGALVDGHAGWMRYFGVIGYDDISKAAIQAASDPDVKQLMFHIDSPGGDVNGVADCGRLLNQVSSLKPSMVYTSSTMHSGGYWLGSSIKGTMQASQTASVGSIGVVVVQTNYADANAKAGIDTRVMRAGKYKVELNSAEKPTDEALARLQDKLDYVHGLFRAQVKAGRPNLGEAKLLEVTEGQTFMGPQAKAAGLVDKIGTFEQALKLLDSTKTASNTSSTSKGATMAKISELTPEQLALIESQTGIKLEDGAAAPAAPVVAAPAAPVAAPVVAAPAAPAVAAPAADPVVAELRAQLATKDTELVTAKAELMNLKATAPAQDKLMAGLRKETSRMLVALKASDAALEGMDAAALVAEYDRVVALFETQFKPGGVGASGAEVKDEEKPAALDPMFLHRLQHAPSAKRQ